MSDYISLRYTNESDTDGKQTHVHTIGLGLQRQFDTEKEAQRSWYCNANSKGSLWH